MAAGLFLLLVGMGLAAWSIRTADLEGLSRSADELRRQMRRDTFVDLVDTGLMPDADWSDAGNGRVVYTMKLESECPDEFEVMAWMKCWDGTWFERSVYPHATNVTQRLALPLDEGWHNKSGTVRFSPAWLLRVRETGLRLRGPTNVMASLSLDAVEALAPASLPALAASNLSAPAKVPVHDVWDLRFDLNRALGNPFDAEQVDLRCTAEGPEGARLEVPCFFVLDHRSTAKSDGSEEMVPLAAPRWGARISPDRPGTWRVKISGHDSAGELAEQDLSFTAMPSDLPGPVKTEGRWFSRDKRFFYPTTINLRSPHDDLLTHLFPDMKQPSPNSGSLAMEPWIRRCADNGLNWMRVWSMPGSMGLEWERGWKGYHGRGVYNLANASRLDRLLAAARERRVTVELALWQHGPWTRDVDTQWADNPWNQVNGGPLKNPQDALKDPLARAGQRNLIRYCAARWGPDPALAAWTLWIEIDGTTRENTSAWHAEMAEAMKSVDPLDHPVSAEFRSPWGDSRVFSLPGIDFTQVAAYDSGGLLTTFRVRANTFARYDKPVILEEYGGHSTGGSGTWLAQQLHDGPWAAWNMNFSASPMGWWWNLIFAERLDRHYARFAEYIRGEDLSNGKWRLEESGVEGTTNLMAVLRLGETRAYAWIYSRDLVDVHSPLEQNGWWRHAMMSSTLYDLRRGAWNPLAQDNLGEQFSADRAVLNLTGKGLRPGRWGYELWDTWTTNAPVKGEWMVGDTALLTLPPLKRDVAVKLVRLGE